MNELERLRQMIIQNDRYSVMLGIEIVDGEPGWGRVQAPLDTRLLNSLGGLHGGAIASLADMAFGVAANYGQEAVMLTTQMNISFMKRARSGPIVAEGRLVNGNPKVAAYEVKVFDGEGSIIAIGLFSGYRLGLNK